VEPLAERVAWAPEAIERAAAAATVDAVRPPARRIERIDDRLGP
jgi:hypothetical protein